ncbi:MAG: hypothetical protein HDS65_08180 [Bacteroidales bacterium]|nr:hypothetical protein [Bacteroidales bacterium]
MLMLALPGAMCTSTTIMAEAPSGYYTSCENKGGAALLTALYTKINSHTVVSYAGLLDLYKKSDVYPDGTIWDMYSTKHWTPGTTCGNYSKVGDCYNREHSFPKSWFNDASPMYSDAFHLYPTDGKVNGQRSNYPYGECSGGTTLASNGSVKALGRLGKCTFPGYSGTVFEPDDEYKGDFARSYFYMAACYNDRIKSWKSDMLAGNSYPAFSSWAIELLLKWNEMDPVSQKELDRQEAVYAAQRNRNPFIDYPDLAEYIWGAHKNDKWTTAGATKVVINQPVSGSTLDLGCTAAGVAVNTTLRVLTTNAKEDVKLSTGNSAFTVSPSSISASSANAGQNVTVTYTPSQSTVGTASTTLYVKCADTQSTVTLKASAVNGLPLNEASNITDESFTATWTYIGDADAQGNYTLTVSDDAGVLPGYPKAVNAAAARYNVTGLTPDTDYTFSLKSETLVSEYRFVRTAQALPSIDFFFDGELSFKTAPGEPSDAVELLIATDNIDSNYTVSVTAPFEISFDLSDWRTSLTLTPDDSRIYLRFNSDREGTFQTSVTAQWGEFISDDAAAIGTAVAQIAFLEDFEEPGTGSYSAHTYHGTACTWQLNDAGIWPGDQRHSGDQALRAGRGTNAEITMAEDRERGLGTVSFWARPYVNDDDAEFDVQYSTDGGKNYKTAGTVKIVKGNFAQYSVFVGANAPARLRLKQKSGKRVMIDDITITDTTTGLSDPAAERHQWAAYSRHGVLTVDVHAAEGLEGAIYCIDGRTLFAGHFHAGENTVEGLEPGSICVVHIGDFSRTVIIR